MTNTKRRSIGHVKRLSNGKYLLRLSLGTDDFGKRIQPSKTVSCKSMRDAERLLCEFYEERDNLKKQSAIAIPHTLGQVYREWFAHHVTQNLSSKTAEWYATLWNTHISFAAEVKLEILSPAHIHYILQSVQGERSKNAVYKLLSAMLNKAVKWGYLQQNPCKAIDTPTYHAKEKEILSQADFQTLIPLIEKEPLKYQALFYFAVLCGLRRQECVGLRWTDIDFADNAFSVQTVGTQLHGEKTSTKQPKTKKSERKLFLPEILKNLLIQLQTEQVHQRFMCGDKWVDGQWVFTQWNGQLMGVKTPSQWWNDFKERNHIKNGVTFHGLRHTSATYMIKNNVPISTVSGVLGHAKISTTVNVYTHVIEDTKKEAISVMADMMESLSGFANSKQQKIG